MDPAAIADAFRDPDDLHEPITGLVVLENTHAHSGGRPLPLDYVADGGARSPTSAASRSTSTARGSSTPWSPWASTPGELAAPADSVTFCLSKGLSTPVGSRRRRARAVRRPRAPRAQAAGRRDAPGRGAGRGRASWRLGDGPDGTIARLAEDHANARRLAEGLARLDGVRSPGGIAQPGDGAARPGPRRDQLRPVPRGPRPLGVPRRPRGARRPAGPLRARLGPRRHPPRDHGAPTSTGSSTTVGGRPARDRARARPASRRPRAA